MPQARSRKLNRRSNRQEYGEISYGYQGKPVGDNDPKLGISVKSLRDLPKSSYSVQADPYTAALPGSEPYAILNRFNKTIGGFYGGDRNLDGGNVQQYANSLRSKFLHANDFCRLPLGMNYHYIPTKVTEAQLQANKYKGFALIDEQIRAVAEATSTLQSTTFTQMAVYNYSVATDMPMGSSYNNASTYKADDGTELKVYDDLNDVIYSACRYYQIFWLKVLGLFDYHNSFRLKMGTMIRSAWNREVPALNSLFGLFKKKSFLSLLNSMAMSLPGEYIDREFALQFSKTCLIPSRRSNSISDPVLETQVEYNEVNRFILLFRSGVGDDKTYEVVFDSKIDLFKTVPNIKDGKSFKDAVHDAMTLLSAEDTMKWARNQGSSATTNDTVRFNTVRAQLDVVQACITTMKKAFTDIREVLDTCARTGIVTWYKGFRPSIVKDDDAALFKNLIVDDIYKLALGGAATVTLNSDTKRFRTYSFWNMYDGIPEFDAWSGGSFLTFSLKVVEDPDDDPDLIMNYLPDALTYLDNGSRPIVYTVTRLGTEYTLTTSSIQLSRYVGTRRLVPLDSQDLLNANVVTLSPVVSPTVDQASDYSFIAKSMTQITGMCYVNTSIPVIYTDPDLLAVYQIEIEDITNEMIAYARKTGPFLGAVAANSKIGFLGTVNAGSMTTKLAVRSED